MSSNPTPNVTPETEVPPQPEISPIDAQDEQEEPVDIELQNAMKKATIDDSVFSQDAKKEKKIEPKTKNKKSKGVDFLEYASKNKIEFNIEYEEDKHDKNKKNDKREGQYTSNYHKEGKYQKKFQNQNNNTYNDNNKYNNKPQEFKKQTKRQISKFGGNKFDTVGFPNRNMQPLQMQEGDYTKQFPDLNDDEKIIKYLDEMFSVVNLNRDIYLRKNISNEGTIDIKILSLHFAMVKNNIKEDKIAQLVPQTNNLNIKKDDDDGNKKIIIIKNFKDMQLVSIETIVDNKRAKKMQMQRMKYYPNQEMNMNPMMYGFMPFQNNNYYYQQNLYFQGYPQQFYGYQPQQQQMQPQTPNEYQTQEESK